METSKLAGSRDASVKIIPRKFLGKVAKFGGNSFNRHEVIHLQTWRGSQKLLPPQSDGVQLFLIGVCFSTSENQPLVLSTDIAEPIILAKFS